MHIYLNLLKKYLAPQRRQVILLGILLCGGIALDLANPQIIRFFLDQAQAGGSQSALLQAAGLFIAFALGGQALGLAATFSGENISWTATNHLRTDLMRHCLELDMPFHKRHTPGELIERVDGDVTQLANFFSQFIIYLLANSVLVIGILILLFREDIRVGAGLTLYALLTLALLGALQRVSVSRWAAARQSSAELFGFIEERVGGAEDIQACGAQTHILNRLYKLMRNNLIQRRAAFLLASLVYNLTNLLYAIGYAFGLALGIYLYTQGQASIGTAYLIVFYVGMLSEPLQNIRRQIQDLQQASASIQRIQALFALQPAVQATPAGQAAPASPAPPVHLAASGPDAPAAAPLCRLQSGPPAVAFQNVFFRYDDEVTGPEVHPAGDYTLKDISFDLQPGEVLGVLGRTGSGKTTLTRLLFRLYDPSRGAIYLNGTDISTLPPAELRAAVGMVTQDVQLFQASIRDNLAFFNPHITADQIIHALQELQLMEWLHSLPEGLDTRLSSGGQGLSAGQAQLLAFTRVFLKDPGVIILDEASSRLDPATETLLERAIDRLLFNRTAIIIAHRLHTVQRADCILILEEGRLVEFGRRRELAADPNSRFYRLLQTGLEETLV